NIGQSSLTFNGIQASFQNNNSTFETPGALGANTAFLFASPSAPIGQAASESAKAFVDVLKLTPYNGAGQSEADVPLPPIFPTIWTSSYEVYRAEKEAAVKK